MHGIVRPRVAGLILFSFPPSGCLSSYCYSFSSISSPMLFLDGVGKPRGTTLILSSTLGAGSVERPPLYTHTWKLLCLGSLLQTGKRGRGRNVDKTRRSVEHGTGRKGKEFEGWMREEQGEEREWRAQLDQRVAKLKAKAIAGGRAVGLDEIP